MYNARYFSVADERYNGRLRIFQIYPQQFYHPYIWLIWVGLGQCQGYCEATPVRWAQMQD